MPSLRNAHILHDRYYIETLRESDRSYYLGHDNLRRGLDLFDSEWANIRASQVWAQHNANLYGEAASLCINFPYWGAHILDLRLGPRERIRWLEAALTMAQRLNDREAESRNLNDLGLAYWQLGDMRIAIQFFEKALVIEQQDGDRRGEMHTQINLAGC